MPIRRRNAARRTTGAVPRAGRYAMQRPLQLALLCCTVTAAAGQWQGFLGVSSDNVYRGLTQSAGDPSIIGDAHWRGESGWFAGAGLATVNLNPGPGAPVEIAAYAGRATPLSRDLSGRFTLIHYEYPQERTSLAYGYEELLASLAWRDRAYLNLAYSPNTTRFTFQAIAVHRPAWSAELVGRQPLGNVWGADWSAGLGLGQYQMAAPIDRSYAYWNASLTATRAHWQLDIAAIGTSGSARDLFGYARAGDRWAVTLLRRFSSQH
jgi:uncharacterized protein (TIGR02001 family)